MRLWHYDILLYLPKKQIQGQWSELNDIMKNETRHILINYVYDYSVLRLLRYAYKVLECCKAYDIKLKKADVINEFLKLCHDINHKSFKSPYDFLECKEFNANSNFNEHDNEYLEICFYNLKEKYIRGQNDFSKTQYDALCEYVKGV